MLLAPVSPQDRGRGEGEKRRVDGALTEPDLSSRTARSIEAGRRKVDGCGGMAEGGFR